jgi:PAS domain S-box-containing protein
VSGCAEQDRRGGRELERLRARVAELEHVAEETTRPEALLRRALDLAPVGALIASRGAGGAVRSVNREFTAITGYTLGDVPTMSEWISRAYPDETLHAHALASVTESSGSELPSRVTCSNGTVKDVLVRTGAVNDSLMVVLMTDISDRLRAEQERERLAERAAYAQKMESLGLLAGGIAHDFNNLLVGVMGNADLALTVVPPEHQVAERLQDIVRAAGRASDLIRQLLTYAGHGTLAKEPVRLAELLGDMADLMEIGQAHKGALHVAARDVPPIEADPAQLRQVVMNLITNASEALGPGGGEIAVSTRVVPATAELLEDADAGSARRADVFVALEVQDTGLGMDEATRARIFEPFFTTKFAGRGLGMATVLGIVRSHGGTIAIESAPGEGTRVTCLFPAIADSTDVEVGASDEGR